ncbi:MAG TPA: hypothetical protein VJB57_18650 [Dehalococcoidia bacterium]|nr:hypothetical protein [Dehalococcoidia bacterium]
MADKSEHLWEQAAGALDLATEHIAKVPGVISIHAQYAEPLAVMVVLVENEDARRKVVGLECELFHKPTDLALDIHVQRVEEEDLEAEQAALATAFGLFWSRN